MKNLLEQFSCSLLCRGKKGSGYKVFLESLFFLRQNYDKTFLNRVRFEKLEDRSSYTLESDTQLSDKIAKREIALKEEHNKKEQFVKEGISTPINMINMKVSSLPYKDERATSGGSPSPYRDKRVTSGGSRYKDERATSGYPYNDEGGTSFLRGNRSMISKETLESVKNVKQKRNEIPFTESQSSSLTRQPKKTDFSILLNQSICKRCVYNVKPILETRKVRKGRVTYRVPLLSHIERQEGKGVFSLIESATLRKKSFPFKFLSSLSSPIVENATVQLKGEDNSFSNHSRSEILKEKLLSEKIFQDKVEKKLLRFSLQHTVPTEKKLFFLASLGRINLYSKKYLLSEELFDSFFEKGRSIDKKKDLNNVALKNRAYTNYRWW